MTDLAYREQQPGVLLGQFVECFWAVETSAATPNAVPPDGCVDIVFSPDLDLRVVGSMTIERVFPLSAGAQIIGVRFRPGMARAVLGIPLGELTDKHVQLEDLWPRRGKELKSQLAETPSAVCRLEALCHSLHPIEQILTPIQHAIRTMSLAHGNVRLDHLVSQTNLSSRQFRRRCYEETGLAPKQLCRILRFRRARQIAGSSPKPNWSRIAAETGYFDQAHLIRDFHEFTGRTPMSVLSNPAGTTFAYATQSEPYENHARPHRQRH